MKIDPDLHHDQGLMSSFLGHIEVTQNIASKSMDNFLSANIISSNLVFRGKDNWHLLQRINRIYYVLTMLFVCCSLLWWSPNVCCQLESLQYFNTIYIWVKKWPATLFGLTVEFFCQDYQAAYCNNIFKLACSSGSHTKSHATISCETESSWLQTAAWVSMTHHTLLQKYFFN